MSIFNTVKLPKIKRNAFNLSFENRLTLKAGDIVPFICQDVVPGDTYKVNSQVLIKMPPMYAPMFQRMSVYVHYFFVPYRIIWKDFEDFITKGVQGNDTPVYPTLSFPYDTNNFYLSKNGTLADYLGFPTSEYPTHVAGDAPVRGIDALPFRAYNRIYYDYYCDQTLNPDYSSYRDYVDSNSESIVGSGETVLNSGTPGSACRFHVSLKQRAWEHDYFTSSLPWPQRGTDVTLPLGNNAPVKRLSQSTPDIVNVNGQLSTGDIIENYNPPTTQAIGVRNVSAGSNGKLESISGNSAVHISGENFRVNENNFIADLRNATAATINDLRRAFSLQRWFERNALGGSRYAEQIYSHFGVMSKDSRLQRAEYLGGGKSPIVMSEVLQNSQTSSDHAQGNRSGLGMSLGKSNTFKRFFTEHGIVMGLMSIRPRSSYYQGLPRQFSRRSYTDFYFPEFAHLGEQPVLNKEIYLQSDNADGVFGYQSQYAWCKWHGDEVHGNFKDSLLYWSLARKFDSQPRLNNTFVTVPNSITDRAFPVTADKAAPFMCDIWNDIKAVRPMPKFGSPSVI